MRSRFLRYREILAAALLYSMHHLQKGPGNFASRANGSGGKANLPQVGSPKEQEILVTIEIHKLAGRALSTSSHAATRMKPPSTSQMGAGAVAQRIGPSAPVITSPLELEESLTADSRSEEQLNPTSGSQDGALLLDDGWATGFAY